MSNPPSRRNPATAKMHVSVWGEGARHDSDYQRAGTILGTEARNEWEQTEVENANESLGRVMLGDKGYEAARARKGPPQRARDIHIQGALVRALRNLAGK